MPREYADPRTYSAVVDAWTRVADLGLGGGLAATLEDPAVGAEILARDAAVSQAAGPPGSDARATWRALYGDGDRLPIKIVWRFDRHLYEQSILDPGSGWTFTLVDDLGFKYSPVAHDRLTVVPNRRLWIGEFTLWFPRRSLGGRTLFTSHTRDLTLEIVGTPGQARMTWRFLPLLDNEQFGLFDQMDSPGAASCRRPVPTERPAAAPTPSPTASITI